jgi:methylated-DNA-[protein]-cysteine S-methyltransferase
MKSGKSTAQSRLGMDKELIERVVKNDAALASLVGTLSQMGRRARVPMPEQRAAIRARLLQSSAETNLTAFETRIGWIGLAWNARGIVTLLLPRPTRAHALRDLQREYPDAIVRERAPAEMVRELEEYVEGQRRSFDLPLDWSSIKPFQRAVLQAASTIPFGETRSYGWIARQIGKPRAARAVGRALGANPIPIILPCHRVINSNGELGGYGGGLPLKVKLLRLEGAALNL